MSTGGTDEGPARLQRLTGLIVNQVSHWSEARWGSHADRLHEIVQRIAGPEHKVPRIGAVVLPDQLRVVVADLVQEGDPARIVVAIDDLAFFRGTLKASQ